MTEPLVSTDEPIVRQTELKWHRIKDFQSRCRSEAEALGSAIGKKNEMISGDPECLVGPYFAGGVNQLRCDVLLLGG